MIGNSKRAWGVGCCVWVVWAGLVLTRVFLQPAGLLAFVIFIGVVTSLTTLHMHNSGVVRISTNKYFSALAQLSTSVVIISVLAVNFKEIHRMDVFYIPTGSMAPAIAIGEVVVADTAQSAIDSVSRGDIVVFNLKKCSSDDVWIKRVTDVRLKSVSLAGDNADANFTTQCLENIPKNSLEAIVTMVVGSVSPDGMRLSFRTL